MLPAKLVWGPLLQTTKPWPLRLDVQLCDVRSRFIAKGRVGKGHRFIARNGRVLLATTLPLGELVGQAVALRMQIWHRAILPEDAPEPYGVLLTVRTSRSRFPESRYGTRLVSAPTEDFALALALGGQTILEFTAAAHHSHDSELPRAGDLPQTTVGANRTKGHE